jgi:EmrB/QacA subfamily drug resistance transporter
MTHRSRVSPRLILAVVAYGVFVAADDLTVVSTMLRQIVFDLEIPLPEGLSDAAWIVNAYLIAYVVVMPFIGKLSDIFGRRTVYMAAFTLFLLGSIWIPLAPNLPLFLVGRVITALGGGAMVPVAMAVIGDVYEPKKRAGAMGILGTIDTAGWIWGPLYGALLVRYLSWEWQFYLNIPLSVVGIAAAYFVLRDLPTPSKKVSLDWTGVTVLSLGLIALNVALLGSGDVSAAGGFATLPTEQPTDYSLPLYLVALIAFIAFIFIERRAEHPLIDLRLFRRLNFRTAVLINFLIGFILIIAMVNVPLIINLLELNLEQAALDSGQLLSALTIAMAIMAYVGGQLTERYSYRPTVALGLLACVTGFALMGFTWQVDTSYGQMAWQLAILGCGFGLVISPIGTAVNSAGDDERGVASSLVIVLRLMGMSVGLSGLTAWGLERFNHLRTQIQLPDLPFTDPVYQQAIVDGLTQTTVHVLTETFLISAAVAVVAVIIGLRLRPDEESHQPVSDQPVSN